MVRLLLVRHGQTEYNKNHMIQGITDTELNDTGIAQAEHLASRLESIDIDAAYSSGLQRARKTAEIAASPHNLSVEQVPDLNERNYGVLEGKDADTYYDSITGWEGPRHKWTPEDGESMEELAQRGMNGLNQISENHVDETVLVVAHGTMNQALLAAMVGTEPGYGYVFSQDNTCVNRIHWNDPDWHIMFVNDTRHLDGELRPEYF